MRTVTNACYDELRRQKRRPTTPLEPDTDDGEEMDSPRWLADPGMTPPKNLKQMNSSTPFSTASTTSRLNSKLWWSWPIFKAWITPK